MVASDTRVAKLKQHSRDLRAVVLSIDKNRTVPEG
jgi:hypothetical protein